MNRKISVLGLGAVVGLVGLTGCTSTGATASATGTPSANPTVSVGPGQPNPGQGSSTGGGSGGGTGNGTGPAECTLDRLDVSITGGDAGSTHRSRVLVFRNTGSTRCVLQGYPGVAALDGSGNQLAQATRTLGGYLGGVRTGTPPRVNLAPGASASAIVEALAGTSNGASCTAYAGLLVTPPDETHSVRLSWGSDGCTSLEVHPVVPGTTGSAG